MLPVARLLVHCVTPPNLNGVDAYRSVLRILQTEEYEDDRDRHAGIECGGQHIVVLRPPREVASTDDILEDEPYDRPRHKVYRRSRRNRGRA